MERSDLRVQVQTDARYFDFVEGSAVREAPVVPLPVADVKDILQWKVRAALDGGRRPSKRRKDLWISGGSRKRTPCCAGVCPLDCSNASGNAPLPLRLIRALEPATVS